MISGFDIVLIVALIAFTVNGFSKGLIAKVLSLAALLAGIVLAARYSKDIAVFLWRTTGLGESYSGVIGVALLFIGLFILSALLAKACKQIPIFKVWDKFGGAVFGFLEGVLLLSLLLLLLSIFDIPPANSSSRQSLVYSPVKNFAPSLYHAFVTSSSTEKYIDQFFSPRSPEKK